MNTSGALRKEVNEIANFDYSSVKPEDLEMRREPRKSKFIVIHKPSSTRAEDPVSPGAYQEVRFRRPAGMPKENRPKDMTGFIEARGEGGKIFPIVETEGVETNHFLIELANDPEALKRSFEGQPEEATATTTSAKTAEEEPQQPEQAAATAATAAGTQEETPATPETPKPAPEADTSEVSGETKQELDDLLAGLEG